MWKLKKENKSLGTFLCGAITVAVVLVVLPKAAYAKTLQFQDQTWQINPTTSQMSPQISLRSDLDLVQLSKNVIVGDKQQDLTKLLDTDSAAKIVQIAMQMYQPAKDAQLTIENKVATEFEPGQKGQALDEYAMRNLLLNGSSTLQLPVLVSTPKKTLADTNNLGIKELVAIGESNFSGSPANRIVNVKVGSLKFDRLIIDPGQEFSFNQFLGDVDAEHGFLPELVIKASGVTPEFGGGLCQVSTTAFRAAMNAGMPITARRNHSFAVQYYAPQGSDATIYPGVSDMKFINNLSSSLLIHTRIDGTKLYFEFYGTKDDRQVTFEGPTIYDSKPDGSMKSTWIRHVVEAGQTSTQTFNSNYLPPALFHETIQTSTPNPQATH